MQVSSAHLNSYQCISSAPLREISTSGILLQKRTAPRGFLLSGPLNLATSYSRTTYRCTTIGAAAFHFRVRDGNGWCHRAMITRGRNRENHMLPWTSQDFGSLETRSLPCRFVRFSKNCRVLGSCDPIHRCSLTSADSSKKCLNFSSLSPLGGFTA